MHKHQCLHKISFSKRNSGITWLASLTSCVSRDGSPLPPVNDQIFNILRLFCTTLCLSIDVTWANVFLLVEIANYANASCKPGGQWGWHFSSHNTPVYSLLQIVHRHIIWLIYVGFVSQIAPFPISTESTELRSLLPEDKRIISWLRVINYPSMPKYIISMLGLRIVKWKWNYMKTWGYVLLFSPKESFLTLDKRFRFRPTAANIASAWSLVNMLSLRSTWKKFQPNCSVEHLFQFWDSLCQNLRLERREVVSPDLNPLQSPYTIWLTRMLVELGYGGEEDGGLAEVEGAESAKHEKILVDTCMGWDGID